LNDHTDFILIPYFRDSFFARMKIFSETLQNKEVTTDELVLLMSSEGEERLELFQQAQRVKLNTLGNKVFLRGLIEFSNICAKDCLYCGIRKSNEKVVRYDANDNDILEACDFALKNRFGSVVLQSGENSSPQNIARISRLLRMIKNLSGEELGITLSCGEQTLETYLEWRESGAHRYLLRIETSNRELYRKIHPDNSLHRFDRRIQALNDLKEAGFQLGTGVMIGLPFQSISDLANDLQFFKDRDVDMVGMGPFIEHEDTPLYAYKNLLLPKEKRFDLALKMIAALRLLMTDINIAAATALQAIDQAGREKALTIGANILMPNLTQVQYRKDYQLYEGKPCLDEDAELCKNCLEARIEMAGCRIGYGEWGDSEHYLKK